MTSRHDDSIATRTVKRRRLAVPAQTMEQFEGPDNASNNASVPSIHCLSEECLQLILSNLTPCELIDKQIVCKRWFNACRNSISLLQVIHAKQHLIPSELDFWRIQKYANKHLMRILGLNFGSLTTLMIDIKIIEEYFVHLNG